MGDSDHEKGRKEERRVADRRQLPRERRAGPGRRIWIRRSSAEEVDEERRRDDLRSGEPRRSGQQRRTEKRRKGDRRLD